MLPGLIGLPRPLVQSEDNTGIGNPNMSHVLPPKTNSKTAKQFSRNYVTFFNKAYQIEMSKNKLDLYTNRMFSEVLQIVQSRTNNTNLVKK